MVREQTTIMVFKDTYDRLNGLRGPRPQTTKLETFDTVINRLLRLLELEEAVGGEVE